MADRIARQAAAVGWLYHCGWLVREIATKLDISERTAKGMLALLRTCFETVISASPWMTTVSGPAVVRDD